MTPGEPERIGGKCYFLRLSEGTPPPSSTWLFTSPGGESRRLESEEDGSLVAPEGAWRIECLDGVWVPENGLHEVFAGGKTIVWLREPVPLEVIVTDEGGRPVPDCRVSWTETPGDPHIDPDVAWLHAHGTESARTGDDGVARMIVTAPGFLSATHTAYAGSSISLPFVPADRVSMTVRFPPSGELQVECLDAVNGAPIVGAVVDTPFGRVPASSDAGGVVSFPRWAVLPLDASISATGYCPRLVRVERNREIIDLYPASRVSVTVQPVSSQDAPAGTTILCEVERPGSGRAVLTRLLSEEVKELSVPLGALLRAYAFSSDGRAGVAEKVCLEERESLEVLIAREAVLQIRGLPHDGGATAHVQLENGQEYRLREVDDSLFIPTLLRPLAVTLQADGCERMRLHPHPDGTRPLTGTLDVDLEPVAEFRLRVVDESGSPSGGWRLTMDGLSGLEVLRNWPELHGAMPTSHPGWVRRPQPTATATTNGRGEASFWLARGRYTLSASLPYERTGLGAVVLSDHQELIDVPREGQHDLVVQAPARTVLQGVDALSGTPVDSISVQGLQQGTARHAGGNPMAVWGPAGAVVIVSSPGYSAESVTLLPERDAEFRRVELTPTPSAR